VRSTGADPQLNMRAAPCHALPTCSPPNRTIPLAGRQLALLPVRDNFPDLYSERQVVHVAGYLLFGQNCGATATSASIHGFDGRAANTSR
jgi:hypothetical protein